MKTKENLLKIIQEAEEAINNLPSQNQWISIDTPPKER